MMHHSFFAYTIGRLFLFYGKLLCLIMMLGTKVFLKIKKATDRIGKKCTDELKKKRCYIHHGCNQKQFFITQTFIAVFEHKI